MEETYIPVLKFFPKGENKLETMKVHQGGRTFENILDFLIENSS